MSSCGHRHGRQRMLIEKALGIELEFLEGMVNTHSHRGVSRSRPWSSSCAVSPDCATG